MSSDLGGLLACSLSTAMGSRAWQVVVAGVLPPIGLAPVQVDTQPVASGFTAPLYGTTAPGIPGALFVVDQIGIVWRVDLASGRTSTFLDARALLVRIGIRALAGHDERGMLGLAFDPQFATTGLFYTYTSEPAAGASDFAQSVEPDHQNVVREWHVGTARSRVVMRVDWPTFDRNGGMLAFGADGMLYVALGGDAQSLALPYGKLLRIDPRACAKAGYRVPPDNPFVGHAGVLPEIYATGLRDLRRYSFDPATGVLIAGDAQEIDVILAGRRVADHAIARYERDHEGVHQGRATIGGFVYRGSAIPDLRGHYVFGDYTQDDGRPAGRLLALADLTDDDLVAFAHGGAVTTAQERVDSLIREPLDMFTLGFARDDAGEIYVVGNRTGIPSGTTGELRRLVAR